MTERRCENCKWFRYLQLIGRYNVNHVDGYCINPKHAEGARKQAHLAYSGDMFCSMYEDEDSQTEIKKDSEMYKEVYKVTEDITLKEFLLHRARILQLCTIRSSGWIEGTAWIDYEDLFINSLDEDTLDKKVESYEMGTLNVLDADGNKIDVPCMHIDLVYEG